MDSPTVAWIEVVYALPGRQFLQRLPLSEGLDARAAVEASGVFEEWPALRTQPLRLAIYGAPIEPDRCLCHGDRVEILRPLQADPRQARRKRLARGGSGRARRAPA